MGVPTRVRRRQIVAAAVVAVLSIPAGASAGPDRFLQEDSSEESHEAATENAVVEINVDVAEASPSDISGAITDMEANISAQLDQVRAAQAAVDNAAAVLIDKTAVVTETQFRLEELTAQMDAVVVEAFMSPPGQSALEVLSSASAEDATIRQTMLDMQADEHAGVLADFEETRTRLEQEMEAQEAAAADAAAARAAAEAALADLEAAVSQEAEFLLAVQARLDGERSEIDRLVQSNPELAARIQQQADQLTAAINQVELQRQQEEAQRLLEEARERAAGAGEIVCPVAQPVTFVDSWGAPRSGGRSHKGVDMMAATGTETYAPVNGTITHRSSSLGGLSWYVYGDDGHTYYGTHLSEYANVGIGRVEAGMLIGYVGHSGNASASGPHLHFEFHPNGGAPINPYPLVDNSCQPH